MPNTGRPSKDCHLCRSRRVKCDLGRPGCERCSKYGVQCPGYREPQDLIFRNATVAARKKRKGPGSSAADASRAGSRSVFSATSSNEFPSGVLLPSSDLMSFRRPGNDVYLPLGTSVNQHWTAHSVPMMLHVYSTLSFLQDVYRLNNTDGPLVWVAHLFSRTYVTNLQNPTALSNDSKRQRDEELGRYLGKTIKSISTALQDPAGSRRDDVLATVWVLANYELLVNSLSTRASTDSWQIHARGILTLLRSRGHGQFYTLTGRRAFWPTFTMVQIYALLDNTEGPVESEEWLSVVKDTLQPMEALALPTCIAMHRMASAQSRIVRILKDQDPAAALDQYDSLVGVITRAGDQMSAVLATATPHGHLDEYVLALYCAALVKVHSIVHFLVNFLTVHHTSQAHLEMLQFQWRRSQKIIQNASDEILALLPPELGARAKPEKMDIKVVFDAMKMIWPLTAMKNTTATTPRQREEAVAALRIIGTEVGVQQALHTTGIHEEIPSSIQGLAGFEELSIAD